MTTGAPPDAGAIARSMDDVWFVAPWNLNTDR
jgi:hypothetical protein